jgi:sugar phosphate isomerase/epimerase
MRNIPEARSLSRRDLLAAGCVLAVGAFRESRAATIDGKAAQASEGPYSPFKMGIQSYSLRGLKRDGKSDLGKALEATKGLGLHYWESYLAHVPMNNPKVLEDAKRALEQADVTLAAYGVVPLTSDVDANRRIFEFAKSLGLEYVSADPNPTVFDAIDKLVEEFGVPVGIHNHGPGHRYAKIATISAAIKDHHTKIGCCIDTGHFLRSREDPVEAAEVFAGRTYGVHLKDVKDAKTFTVLGKGDLRTVDFLKVLAANKYKYCLAIEYEESEDDPVPDIKACLDAAAKAIAQVRNG